MSVERGPRLRGFERAERPGALSSTKNLLLSLGFSASEIPSEVTGSSSMTRFVSKYKDSFKFLAKTLPVGYSRGTFLRDIGSRVELPMSKEYEASLMQGFETLLRKADQDKTQTFVDFADIASQKFALSSRYLGVLATGSRVIVSDLMPTVFGGSAVRMADFFGKYRSKKGYDYLENIDKVLDLIQKHPKRSSRLFNGMDEDTLVNMSPEDVEFLFKKNDRVELLREYLTGSRGWASRLLFFDRVLENEGFATITQEELHAFLAKEAGIEGEFPEMSAREQFVVFWNLREQRGVRKINRLRKKIRAKGLVAEETRKQRGGFESALDRIRKREDKRHPLNSMGIAKTVGFEVEFPSSLLLPRGSSRVLSLLELYGFHFGLGGDSEHEASPGPFYDPETANLIFKRLVDVGFIDLHKYESMTFHFNAAGVKRTDFHTIIRAMYLSGAAYDPYTPHTHVGLAIKDRKNYLEGKVFDVMNLEGFLWTMKTASYLAWAAGAREQLGRADGSKWSEKLARAWATYEHELNAGLKYAGLSGYLMSEVTNHSVKADRVIEQLKLIFPTPASRYDNPSKKKGYSITESNFSYKSDLARVKVGPRSWPNIVSFATDVSNKAVSKIEAIALDIEKECVRDIGRIEKSPWGAKEMLIRRFIKKYNVEIDEKAGWKERENAYNQVKELLTG